jgi:hypothetical protein
MFLAVDDTCSVKLASPSGSDAAAVDEHATPLSYSCCNSSYRSTLPAVSVSAVDIASAHSNTTLAAGIEAVGLVDGDFSATSSVVVARIVKPPLPPVGLLYPLAETTRIRTKQNDVGNMMT